MDNEAPPVYATFTEGDNFIAFWKSGSSSISFYNPSDIHATSFTKSTDSFMKSRSSYQEQGHLDGFDDTINAAWHILGQQCLFIDRTKIELSIMAPGVYWPRIWRGRYDEGALFGRGVVIEWGVGYKEGLRAELDPSRCRIKRDCRKVRSARVRSRRIG